MKQDYGYSDSICYVFSGRIFPCIVADGGLNGRLQKVNDSPIGWKNCTDKFGVAWETLYPVSDAFPATYPFLSAPPAKNFLPITVAWAGGPPLPPTGFE